MSPSHYFKTVKWAEQVVSGLTPVVFQFGPVGLGGGDKLTGQ